MSEALASMRVRRRYTWDEEKTLAAVRKLGTHTAMACHVAIGTPLDKGGPMTFMHALALISLAHHVDLTSVSGGHVLSTPEDVSEIVGCPPRRTSELLRDLKGAGVVKGSMQAGYVLAGPMTG